MPYTNFPDGITSFGVPLPQGSSLPATTGRYIFVSSTTTGAGAGNDGLSPETPKATIDQGIGACTASKGDIVVVMPGHAENLTTADIDLDVAGVRVFGLGEGRNRPVITYSGTTDTTKFDISAANCGVFNIVFNLDSNDGVDSAMTINGVNAEVGFCEFYSGSTGQADTFITVGVADADADRAYIHDNIIRSTTAGAVSAILFAKDHDGLRIINNQIYGDFSDAGISGPTAGDACTNLLIQGNVITNVNAGDWAIELVGTSATGVIANNVLSTDARATALDAGVCVCSGNTWNISTGGDTEAVPVNPVADALTNLLGVDDADNQASTSNVVANDDGSVLERLEGILQRVSGVDSSTNVLGADDSNNDFASTNVAANADGSILERQEYMQALGLSMPLCVEKSDGAVLSGTDPLFDITGGPISILEIVGIVTTQIGAGTTNAKLVITTTTPAATVDMNAAAVDIDADAAGTSYRQINTTAILTPVTAGFVMRGNAFATNDTTFLAPIGQIGMNSDAARAGVIKWYMRYVPLSPNSRVAAAA